MEISPLQTVLSVLSLGFCSKAIHYFQRLSAGSRKISLCPDWTRELIRKMTVGVIFDHSEEFGRWIYSTRECLSSPMHVQFTFHKSIEPLLVPLLFSPAFHTNALLHVATKNRMQPDKL